MSLSELLQRAIAEGATDVHLELHQEPYFRLGNDIVKCNGIKVSDALFTEILKASECGKLNNENRDNSHLNVVTTLENKVSDSLEKVADARKLYAAFSKDSAFSFKRLE